MQLGLLSIMFLSLFYCLILLGVVAFQVGLIVGMPWGRLTQGGKNEGPLPVSGRVAAGLSVIILAAMGASILSAGGGWPNWPAWTGWAALGVNCLVTLANWATPSVPERKLWGPITTVMLVIALAVVVPL